MPGFAPTQGHIASAVPFLGHAVDGLRDGSLQRVMLLAKGSLFLGRMTQMADGMSFLLERNAAESSEEKMP
jgi:betaine reductase